MNDVTHPAHGIDPAEKGSETEQRMRSDFMHAWSSYSPDQTEYDPADSIDYDEYASPWLTGDRYWVRQWCYLENAMLRWRDNLDPDWPHKQPPPDPETLSPIKQRSEIQARHIAEHGFQYDHRGLLVSDYLVDDHTSGVESLLAPRTGYGSGNALADHAANSEHDGFDR